VRVDWGTPRRARDVKPGDVLVNRGRRGGQAGLVDRAFDGEVVVVVSVAWPAGERGVVEVRPLGRRGGVPAVLRPREDDTVRVL
jgi:hypothetical protein